MQHVRKVVVFPFEQTAKTQQGTGIENEANESVKPKINTFKEKVQLKMFNLLRVMAKLANINGYDEEGRIKDNTGHVVEKSDIAILLLNAMSPGKLVIGENDFIYLLKKANVNPDLILNENVKFKLQNMTITRISNNDEVVKEPELFITKSSSPKRGSSELSEKYPNPMIDEPQIENIKIKPTKRKSNFINEINDGEQIKKRKSDIPERWIIPDNDQ